MQIPSFMLTDKTKSGLEKAMDLLNEINNNIVILAKAATATPDTRPTMAPLVVSLSSTGTAQGLVWQTPDHIRLVGLIIGGANSGRYILQIGRNDIAHAFWLQATQSQYWTFSGDDRWEIPPGLEITVSSPSAAAWDATLIYYPAERYIGMR